VVLADTTALMTSVYSQWLFEDRSLHGYALTQQRRYAVTLVTGNDLPWEADGLQRDGPHVREPVRNLILDLLAQAGVSYDEVWGSGTHRLADALSKVRARLDLY
jgi:nicotinamide riboside kinase